MRRFGYFRDPLFLVCSAAYGLNQLVLKPHFRTRFLHSHFNDLLVIPCALPPLLQLHRWLKLRNNDGLPSPSEVILHLVVWSIVMEIVGPRYVRWVTGDPWDIVSYAVGATLAFLWWHRHWFMRPAERLSHHEL